jgi:peptide/nickel transport system permease protein
MRRGFNAAVRLRLSPSAWIGVGLIGLFVLIALLGPLLAPYSPTQQNLDRVLEGPGVEHWLGTDANGVDLLSQLLYGARLALFISGSVVIVCSAIGTFLGLIAGYFRGWIDELIMRVVDILLAFPGILLNIAIVALVAKPGVAVVIFALAMNGWVGYARLVRGQVLSLRERDFIEAARAVGAKRIRIMLRYLLPNILSLIFVQMSFGIGGVISVEATLSVLGLGPQVDYTWGALLQQGANFIWRSPRIVLAPGIAIMMVVLGANLLGDGLRDRFDPKSGRSKRFQEP